MIYHPEAGAAYLSHPRTGSVATEATLRSMGFREDHLSRHARLGESSWWRGLSPEERAGVRVITTVRNPYDALVSWFINQPLGRHGRMTPDWVDDMLQYNPGYLPEGRLYALHGKDATEVMRFETLREDLERTVRELGLPMDDFYFPVRNRTERRAGRPYQLFYDDETRAYVAEVFRQDFTEYGYGWEELDAPGQPQQEAAAPC